MPDSHLLGTVRMTPSTAPSESASTHADSATATVQPRPEISQSR